MYCSNCGRAIPEKAAVCMGCGVAVKRPAAQDSAGAGWWWLGFLIPLAGLLIWVTCNDNQPCRAKKAGIGALVGVIVSVGLCVLFYVLWFLMMFAMATGAF